jgi:hypothetical protein
MQLDGTFNTVGSTLYPDVGMSGVAPVSGAGTTLNMHQKGSLI